MLKRITKLCISFQPRGKETQEGGHESPSNVSLLSRENIAFQYERT